jgi:hypothetical protein
METAKEFFNKQLITDANCPIDTLAHKYDRSDLFKFTEAYHKNCTLKCANTVPYQKCPVCEGEGEVLVNQFILDSTIKLPNYKPCHACKGEGIIPMHVLSSKQETVD